MGSVQPRSLAILSWNCHGLRNPRTVCRLKRISKEFQPDIIFIMESKNPDEMVLKKMEHLKYDCHHLVPPTGHGAGGIGLFWKHDLNLQVLDSNAHVIDTLIKFEGKKIYSSFVHASMDRNERNLLWDQLVAKAIIREEAWLITGDFNDLLSNEEKEGGPERPEGSSQIYAPSSRRVIYLISGTQETLCRGGGNDGIILSDVDSTELRQTHYGQRVSRQLGANTSKRTSPLTTNHCCPFLTMALDDA